MGYDGSAAAGRALDRAAALAGQGSVILVVASPTIPTQGVVSEPILDTPAREEQDALYGRIGAWWGEQVAAGRIVDGHQLEPAATATTVRLDREGRATITDGPFIEGKEMVGGYAILDVADLDAALAVASSWPAPDVLEVRPILERG